MTALTRMHAVVSGTVQGVGFRYWTARKADRLALVGHARNLFDGTVEVEAEGSDSSVAALIDLLWSGPPTATVTGVTAQPVTPRGDEDRFDILR